MYQLFDVATFGILTVKELTGKEARAERLPRYSVWRGNYHLEDFRRKASAIKWANANAQG
jgi:hypothetical protein